MSLLPKVMQVRDFGKVSLFHLLRARWGEVLRY